METIQLNNYNINFYSEEEWTDYPNNIMLEIRKLEGLYVGLVSDISEDLAEEIIRYRGMASYKETWQYYDYRQDKFVSRTEIQTAKQSFQTLSDLEYCVITKIV